MGRRKAVIAPPNAELKPSRTITTGSLASSPTAVNLNQPPVRKKKQSKKPPRKGK